jgi:hypothetical protein
MSLRGRLFCGLAAYLIGGACIVALSAALAHAWAWLLFPWLGLCGWYLTRLRCPECGKPVAFNRGLWMPYARRGCSQCGHDLTEQFTTPHPRSSSVI